jgi:hypothetical protein
MPTPSGCPGLLWATPDPPPQTMGCGLTVRPQLTWLVRQRLSGLAPSVCYPRVLPTPRSGRLQRATEGQKRKSARLAGTSQTRPERFELPTFGSVGRSDAYDARRRSTTNGDESGSRARDSRGGRRWTLGSRFARDQIVLASFWRRRARPIAFDATQRAGAPAGWLRFRIQSRFRERGPCSRPPADRPAARSRSWSPISLPAGAVRVLLHARRLAARHARL